MPPSSPLRLRRSALALAAAMMLGAATEPEPATLLPFDFSRATIGLDVTLGGQPLHMILDTGVDPSIVDLALAERIGLKVDRGDPGEASGFGDGKGAAIFPTRIEGLAAGGRRFAGFEALATDMAGISAGLGRRLDGVLGYSFLSDKTVLIDYPGENLTLLSRSGQAAALTRSCRTRWTTPLRTVDSFPVIPAFRFGKTTAPVSIDTGSTGGIGLFPSGLALPDVRAALVENGAITRTGARGEARSATYRLDASVGFGPFALPAGQTVSTYSDRGSRTTRVANIGNRLLAAMKLKLLLDYRRRTMTFFGRCG